MLQTGLLGEKGAVIGSGLRVEDVSEFNRLVFDIGVEFVSSCLLLDLAGSFLSLDGSGLIAFESVLIEEEVLELAVYAEDIVHEFRFVFYEFHGLEGDALDGGLDAAVLEDDLLMVAFDLLVVPLLYEFGHVDEHLVLLAHGLVLERPLVVREISDVGIVFRVVPSPILLISPLF